jgi:DNA-binding GntR family transcriptional regulator
MAETIKNKKQFAYEIIRERILDGTYVAGYRLVIDRLSKEFGLSSIPVREALRSLESDGLVEFKTFTGPQVRFVNETEYIEKISVLAALEGLATALSSANFPKKNLHELEKINQNMTQALENFDLQLFSELNREFHATIYKHCDNSYLVDQIKNIWESLGAIKGTKTGLSFRLSPQRCRVSIEEHQVIIKFLAEEASLSKIEAFVREHKMSAVRIYQNNVKKADEDLEKTI